MTSKPGPLQAHSFSFPPLLNLCNCLLLESWGGGIPFSFPNVVNSSWRTAHLNVPHSPTVCQIICIKYFFQQISCNCNKTFFLFLAEWKVRPVAWSAPHQTAARHTHWPYFSLTWKFCWDHQWVSFTFTVRRWQEWGQALAWCFFFPCSFSSQRWRSTYNTNVFPRMYALGWAGQPTDRATFSGWFIFCGSQCVLGQGQFRWELDHKTQLTLVKGIQR